MGNGPLDDPRLLAVERALDRGRLEEAQSMLASLDDVGLDRQGKSYLTTRLLFQRGRLSVEEVAARLDQVLRSIHDFPQARALLAAARAGTLSPEPLSPGLGPGDTTQATSSRDPPATAPQIPGPPALPNFHPMEPELPSPSLAPPAGGFDTDALLDDGSLTSAPPTEPEPSDSGDDSSDDGEAIALIFPDASLPKVRASSAPSIPSEAAEGPATLRDAPPPSAPLDDSKAAPAAPHGTAIARRPPSLVDQTPTLFSVLTLLDEHRYTEALMALNASSGRTTPELTLMRARAQLGCGQAEEARNTLERLCESEPIGPELRAGCARLLLEAGDPEHALEQAEIAHAEASGSPAVLLTAAWATLRVARRAQDDAKRQAGVRLLKQLDAGGGPTPALASALWASVWAEDGEPKRALKAAQRALELEPSSVEGLVAQCIAHARLGDLPEAGRAWRRLMAVNHDEALILRPRLTRLGAELERISPSLVPSVNQPASRRVWDPVEAALLSGAREALLGVWEAEAEQATAGLDVDSGEALRQLGLRAAQTLTRVPGFCNFAPYDLSLWSLLRLQVAMDLILGSDPRDPDGPSFGASEILLGAYIGETIRHAYEGQWRGPIGSGELSAVQVATHSASLAPFQLVADRLGTGTPLDLDSLLPLESAHALLPQWRRRIADTTVPPAPWSPADWPSLQDVGTVGRALSRSVIGLYCSHFAEQELDHSIESLAALDSYLTCLAPPQCPVVAESPALKRAAILVGGYVGEVLRRLSGGHWTAGEQVAEQGSEPAGVRAYALRAGEFEFYPVEQLFARTHSRTNVTVCEYVAQVTEKLGF